MTNSVNLNIKKYMNTTNTNRIDDGIIGTCEII